MYQAADKCPNCRATNSVRSEDLGEYKAGECYNCRFDRSGDWPVQMPAPEAEKPVKKVSRQ